MLGEFCLHCSQACGKSGRWVVEKSRAYLLLRSPSNNYLIKRRTITSPLSGEQRGTNRFGITMCNSVEFNEHVVMACQ